MSKNIDNMETKIRLQNTVVVNAYCRDFLPPLPHSEQETLTVQKGRIWPYIPSYKKRTRHTDVLHSINSIICVKVKLLLYLNKHNAMKAYWGVKV